MKTRDRVILISMVLTWLSLGVKAQVSAQSKTDGTNPNPSQPGRVVPEPPLGLDIPGPMTPRPNPGFPEELPTPRTSRPAEIMEEKMVIKPNHIRRAQEALRARGLNPGNDGKLDESTQEALAKFQKQNNLPATGVLDDKTAAKLGVDLKRENN